MSKHRQYTPHELRAMGWILGFAVYSPEHETVARDTTAVVLCEVPGTRRFNGEARRNPKDPYDFGLAVKVALGRAVKEARKVGALE